VIPPRSNRNEQIDYDRDAYKRRNLIERCVNRLKQFRRIATGSRHFLLSPFIAFAVNAANGQRRGSALSRDHYAAFRVIMIAHGDVIERHVHSIGRSVQNLARNTDIFAARLLGLDHRLFET
jgi:hypothetical protein